MTLDGRRHTTCVHLPLPTNSSVPGGVVNSQWVVLDPQANWLGLTTSNTVRVTIASQFQQSYAWIESTEKVRTINLRLMPRSSTTLASY